MTGVLTGSSQVGTVSLQGAGKILWSGSSGLATTSLDLRFSGPDMGPSGATTYSIGGSITGGACDGAEIAGGLPLVQTTGDGTNASPVVGQRFGNSQGLNFLGPTGAVPHC